MGVDDKILENFLDSKLLFDGSQLALLLQPPLSYGQLSIYCEKEGSEILRGDNIAESINAIVVGCANLLSDGNNADEVYSHNIEIMRERFLDRVSGGRRRRDVSLDNGVDHTRAKRQLNRGIGNLPTFYPLPVASEIVLQLNSIINPQIDPASNSSGFIELIQKSFNLETVASVVRETLGVAIDVTVEAPIIQTSFYYEYDDDLTPRVVRVVADDPDNTDTSYGAGDTITIFFDVNTNQPNVATKNDLDRIFVFNPSLGDDYTGVWLTPSVLVITIVDPALGPGNVRPSVTPPNFSLEFTPNYFHTGDIVTSNNSILPTNTPWCVGVNVCGTRPLTGTTATTIGVCTANRLSCRAYQGQTDLEGDFGTGVPVSVSVFPWWWIIIAIMVVIFIILLIVAVYFIYRYYKHKAQRKEALRVVRRWKKDQFAPGKEAVKKEGPKQWLKPDDVAAMRGNPDPFDGTLRKLPEVLPRPPTAMTEVENLPPVPHQPPFKPRSLPHIRPSVTSPPLVPGGGVVPKRIISTASLPSPLVSANNLCGKWVFSMFQCW